MRNGTQQFGEGASRFEALEVALEAVRGLREAVRRIGAKKPKLADELFRAATSVVLNLGEGQRRVGRDRLHAWRIAAGSAQEARLCLRVAAAWGLVEDGDFGEAAERLDRVSAMLWRLTN